MTMLSVRPPDPIYYLGWIVQPTPDGFEAYPRLDTSKVKSYFFGCLREAFDFINSEVERE